MDEDQVKEPVQDQQPEVAQPVQEPQQVENQTPAQPVPADSTDNTVLMAIVAYFIFFLPLLTEYKSNDFVKYHVKQSILLVILGVGVGVLASIPYLGYILAPLGWMALIVLWVLGIVNASGKKREPLPVVGKYAEELLKF